MTAKAKSKRKRKEQVENAANDNKRPAETQPAPAGKPSPAQIEVDKEKWRQAMSRQFAVVNEHGKALIYRRVYDHSLQHERNEWMTPDSFRMLYDHHPVVIGLDPDGNPKYRGMASAWLDWPGRKQYDQVVFAPNQKFDPADNVLNLWRGFAVKPNEGDWSKLRDHIRDVICAGNMDHYNYVMNWLARCVQFPGDRGETVIVLRGDEGTGKGTLGNHFGKLFGEHYIHAARPQDLLGRFTGHLETAVFVFSDEATFAGDARQAQELKALVTEPEIGVENKFRSTKWVRNVTHLLFASNETWVVPAGPEARRYVVLDVSDGHREDFEYFAAIDKQMKSGGYEAMLYDLLHRDISKFNHRDIPRTAALMEQKAFTLKGTAAWLLECLREGRLGDGRWTGDNELGVHKERTYADYVFWSSQHKEFKPDADSQWGKVLNKVFGDALKERKPREGDERRRRLLVFPSLAECRKAFEKFVKGPVEWPVVTEDLPR